MLSILELARLNRREQNLKAMRSATETISTYSFARNARQSDTVNLALGCHLGKHNKAHSQAYTNLTSVCL